MLESGIRRLGERITGPGTLAKDSILVHGVRFNGILLQDQRTVFSVVFGVFGFVCGKFEFVVWVGFGEPLVVAGVLRDKARSSIHRISDAPGARRQDFCCRISPKRIFTWEPQFEYNGIDRYCVVGEWALKTGQSVNVYS